MLTFRILSFIPIFVVIKNSLIFGYSSAFRGDEFYGYKQARGFFNIVNYYSLRQKQKI